MDLLTLSEVRAHLIGDLEAAHVNGTDSGPCEGCSEDVDKALGTLTRAGWLDRLNTVEPILDSAAILWGGARYVPAAARPDLDPAIEMAILANSFAWALYGDDGRHPVADNGSMALSDDEMELCAEFAQQTLLQRDLAIADLAPRADGALTVDLPEGH